MKKFAINSVRHLGHAAMMPMEKWLTSKYAKQPKLPPVFIIGAPRSGTSLLYELMITAYHFAYISNAAHRFYLTPVTAGQLFKSAIDNWQGNFTSRYGHIDGWGAPNEGGWVWKRWLNDGDWTDGADFPPEHIEPLRNLVQSMSAQRNAPFLNKNVMHSNRLQLMNRIWPDAVYIEVKRDTLDNARSIIRAERAEGGPETHGDWWSVRPILANEFSGKPDTERAIAQVVGVGNDIARDAAIIGPDKFIQIDYETLCKEPQSVLNALSRFLGQQSCILVQRNNVSESFAIKPTKPLDSKDEESIEDIYNILYFNAKN